MNRKKFLFYGRLWCLTVGSALAAGLILVLFGLFQQRDAAGADADAGYPPVGRVGHTLHISHALQGADALTDGRKALPHSGRHRRQAHHRPSGQTRVRVFGSGLFFAIGQHHQSAKLRFGQIGARTKILPDTAHMVHHSEQPCGLRYVLFQDRTSFRSLIVRKAND